MDKMQKNLKIAGIIFSLAGVLLLCLILGNVLDPVKTCNWCGLMFVLCGIFNGINTEIDRRNGKLFLKQKKHKKSGTKVFYAVIWSAVICTVLYLLHLCVEKSDRECVGYRLRDFDMEPIIVKNEIYFPDDSWDFDTEQIEYGNIKPQYVYEKMGQLKNPIDYMYDTRVKRSYFSCSHEKV